MTRKLEDQENAPLIEWLKRHSGERWRGEQCPHHPPLSFMLAHEQIAALLQDTGIAVSRQWLWVLCQRLDIPRRGKLGPPKTVSPEQKKATELNRWRRWYAKVKQDPQALAAYREQHRGRRPSTATP